MKHVIIFLLYFTHAFILQAGKIDQDFLKKITGTKWELTEEKKYGKLVPKKNKHPIQQTITFSTGSMLFDFTDQHYACNYDLKNGNEFWLYCTEPEQYIYRIHSLNNRVLVMDMLVKSKNGKYVRRKRLKFHVKLQ